MQQLVLEWLICLRHNFFFSFATNIESNFKNRFLIVPKETKYNSDREPNHVSSIQSRDPNTFS